MTEKEFRQKLNDLCNEAYDSDLDAVAVYGCLAAVAHSVEFILDMALLGRIKDVKE